MPSNESRSSSFLSEATKMSATANSNDDAPEESSLFKFYIENGYVLPLELKNDIIYCQRAMRDFLKVHGLVSDVFKEQADADPVQMQRILDELEAEVYEINAEQQFLMLRLDHQLDTFYKNLEENNIRTVPEMANEYISSLIVPLIGDASYKIYPQSVLSRDSEEMLIRKHFLISQDDDGGVEPLKLSELDDNVPLMLVNALSASATATASATVGVKPPPGDEAAGEPKLLDEKIESGGGLAQLSPSPSPSPSLMQPTQLQTEKDLLPASKKEQLHSLLIQRGLEPPEEQEAKLIQLSPLPLPPTPPPPPPPLVASKQRAPRADAKQAVKRILTSPPPLAPITKTPLATDFEEVAQSRMHLRQALRRARKTKQQPRQFDEEDVLELPVEKIAESPPQPSVAPTKSKPVKAMEATATAPTTTTAAAAAAAAASTSAAAPAAKKSAPQATSKQYKTRNAHGAGRKPATPPLAQAAPQATAAAGASSGSSGSSDDSHQELELEQQRLCASAAQWRDEPRETRVLPAEYGREHFLGLFGLYTHDMVKKLCQRHSKRKRRTVQNASGVDFHYGQQLTAIDAVRQKKLKDKPEFLLSPKDKRLQAKKAHKANAAAVAVASNRKSKSKTPEKLEDILANGHADVGKHKCKECKKRAGVHYEVNQRIVNSTHKCVK
ncbi:uncharacterized protein Lint-1 isoform X2 [Drosophila virilis]|uniref:Uncharacterized protein, isoform B n=1 Tax=Drosophila virilis TaxID=7244 RepID=A0A0Q9WEC9_DROVI|nr:bromodomain-containing protein 4 isoform X2 [Drosophila virilis]KRF82486.1 uncharacterized protein Dvir_GJ19523, isoform B [Drosophila virilis]